MPYVYQDGRQMYLSHDGVWQKQPAETQMRVQVQPYSALLTYGKLDITWADYWMQEGSWAIPPAHPRRRAWEESKDLKSNVRHVRHPQHHNSQCVGMKPVSGSWSGWPAFMRHNSIVGRRRHVDESIKLILAFQSSSADSKKSWRKSVQIISTSCKPPHAEALDTNTKLS